MKSELENAIRVIEEAGGFVMMQEVNDLALLSDEDVQLEVDHKAYESRKKDAFDDFDKALGSKNFSYGMVEDICYENGIDMDDIEEYIHGHY